jgi:uncharacterized membrane protein YdjX (TVP38/TMEM64 family)
MPLDSVAILVLIGSSVITFTVARVVGRRWRERRREREIAQARKNESRQVRRARERRSR